MSQNVVQRHHLFNVHFSHEPGLALIFLPIENFWWQVAQMEKNDNAKNSKYKLQNSKKN